MHNKPTIGSSSSGKGYNLWRKYKDKATSYFITLGGISIIFVIALMLVFLFTKVIPLFVPGHITFVQSFTPAYHQADHQQTDRQQTRSHPMRHDDFTDVFANSFAEKAVGKPADQVHAKLGETSLYLSMEEQTEVILHIDRAATARFIHRPSGRLIKQVALNIPEHTHLTQIIAAAADSNLLLAALSNGQILLLEHNYAYRFATDNRRTIIPEISYPFGTEPTTISNFGFVNITFSASDDQILVASFDTQQQLQLTRFIKEVNFLTDSVELAIEHFVLADDSMRQDQKENFHAITPDFMAIDSQQQWLFITAKDGTLVTYDVRQSTPIQHSVTPLTHRQDSIADIRLLVGGSSLIVASTQGTLSQWMIVRDTHHHATLTKIKTFTLPRQTEPRQIIAAQRSKDFILLTADHHVYYFNATAARLIFHKSLYPERLYPVAAPGQVRTEPTLLQAALAPRSNMLIAADSDQKISVWSIRNQHSDVSFAALWQKIWYEGYDAAKYIWQSSAANSDFEPKYSLIPLVFGTLKATFYALLFSAPVAILAAIYTACFMAPVLRRKIKPLVELMEAIPTVILGFFAGLVLAPFIESSLPGIFLFFILLPAGVIGFGVLWDRLPEVIRQRIPDSWYVLLLIPVIILTGLFCFGISQPLEIWLLGGDTKQWLTQSIGIDYDQRNALIVGIAIGFAVIPTIFSIAEDGLFAVPRHLVNGSLALGASPWQTIVRVVLPTASPAIFSALMIGLGRAVGETMIILMAAGNTPIMDMNLFEGMRTLAANIAVEMPESAVNSSHYRILFLSGLLLFCFTFMINTIAEQVRYRLRKKYSSL